MPTEVEEITVLVYRPPQIVLLAIDLDENFVDIECIAIAPVFSLQTPGVYGSKLDTPEAIRFYQIADLTCRHPK